MKKSGQSFRISRPRRKAVWKSMENMQRLPVIRNSRACFSPFRSQVLSGNLPDCDCNDTQGRDYAPKASYSTMANPEAKQHDAFLATDCIGTEKLVSGEYNTNVFNFGETGLRKLLADIQIEEQNHAEMLYKYKMVNQMA